MGYEYVYDTEENTCPCCKEDRKLSFLGREWDDSMEHNTVKYKYRCHKCRTEFIDVYKCEYKGTVITCQGGE